MRVNYLHRIRFGFDCREDDNDEQHQRCLLKTKKAIEREDEGLAAHNLTGKFRPGRISVFDF